MATTVTRTVRREYDDDGRLVAEVETTVTTTSPDPVWQVNPYPYVTWWQSPITSSGSITTSTESSYRTFNEIAA